MINAEKELEKPFQKNDSRQGIGSPFLNYPNNIKYLTELISYKLPKK